MAKTDNNDNPTNRPDDKLVINPAERKPKSIEKALDREIAKRTNPGNR